MQSEHQFLQKVAESGVMGIPVLVEYEDLTLEDGLTVDSTSLRHMFWGDKPSKPPKAVQTREDNLDTHVH